MAAPTAIGVARRTATIVVTSVPYTYAAAPKTSLTGSHSVVVKYLKPNVVSDGHESMSIRTPMATSVNGTSIASADTLAAKARSMVRLTSLGIDREKLAARSGHRPQHFLGGLLDSAREWCVAEILCEGLPLVRAVPGETQDRQTLGLVAEVLREQEERERADRPRVST